MYEGNRLKQAAEAKKSAYSQANAGINKAAGTQTRNQHTSAEKLTKMHDKSRNN